MTDMNTSLLVQQPVSSQSQHVSSDDERNSSSSSPPAMAGQAYQYGSTNISETSPLINQRNEKKEDASPVVPNAVAMETSSLTIDETTILSDDAASTNTASSSTNSTLRRIAIDLSLYLNLIILFSKLLAYIHTLSLSVLAALTDSLLDVISQLVLNYTEKHSTKSRSSALYPAGAARLEPLGVLTCAALMGMASFEILKESIESLIYDGNISILGVSGIGNSGVMGDDSDKAFSLGGIKALSTQDGQNLISVYGMVSIVVVKLALYILCNRANAGKNAMVNINNNSSAAVKQFVKVSDPTLEALALDHWNDALSNAVAAVALCAALASPDLWFLDPLGAIIISLYSKYHVPSDKMILLSRMIW